MQREVQDLVEKTLEEHREDLQEKERQKSKFDKKGNKGPAYKTDWIGEK